MALCPKCLLPYYFLGSNYGVEPISSNLYMGDVTLYIPVGNVGCCLRCTFP